MLVKTRISVDKAVTMAKPFVGSLRGKEFTRPVLKTALVTEQHVIATDSHRLIRIQHEGLTTETYLHHYISESKECVASSYPDVSRLFPDKYNAKSEFAINVNEWLAAHNTASVASNHFKNKVIRLDRNVLFVPGYETYQKKVGKSIIIEELQKWNEPMFKHELERNSGATVTYNCQFMLDVLKVYKKLRIAEITCYYYGPHRPMYFADKDNQVDALILPIRTTN